MKKQETKLDEAINNIRVVVSNARMTGAEHQELAMNIDLVEELARAALAPKAKDKKKKEVSDQP